ncbi:uroporphyrinogen-III synthase [Vibrio sp. S9_S30]|uniref:uroporphyrinogen-III synthase n=1 Tax=Vibrio sp. S9_S30 TaxID=2720226 RepID=UPI001680EDC9|nr:uroporphyrinogen-III synthase [Vibrio sp. S9_S30]MBD1559330.1 uroporphyrinogen-III synthase [Vibrio sp. S9_S30]
MAVLVTRPGQDGIELCEALQALHTDAIHHPLIQFQPSKNSDALLNQLHHADIIIAVSQHAVHFTHKILKEQKAKWPESVSYLAIGQKTAYKLGKVTQQKVHYPTTSDSEHFLQLPQLQNVSQLSIVILRGSGGRELIFESLSNKKARVVYAEVYQRHPIPFNPENSIQYWRSRNVDTLIVTSSEQLCYLEQSMSTTQKDWLHTLSLLVPSQRIAILAREQGYQTIVNTGSAANSDLLNAVSKK